ncbi:hypothetical protein [Niveibacterium sp.]|uniref:hypothetical protein n=1 Tax=Niveibacterium sp. TaxID=2017444 RepID=UPI0035B07DDD
MKPKAKAAIAPLQPVVPQPEIGLSVAGAAYIDAAWQANKKKIDVLFCGTHLWHGGIVGPNNPATNQRGLWTTKDAQKSTRYNRWSKEEAQKNGVNAYLTEYITTRDLQLADFGCFSMKDFMNKYCNSQHNTMKQSLIAWVNTKPELRGLVAINTAADDVVVAYPADDLNVISHTII